MDIALLVAALIAAWSGYRSHSRSLQASLEEQRQMLADDRRLMANLHQAPSGGRLADVPHPD